MIEIIDSQEPEKQETRGNYPKNIRQIGTPDGRYRIYMEDYVYTFLHPRKYEKGMKEEDTGVYEGWEKTVSVLLGKKQDTEKEQVFYISGAVRVQDVQFNGDAPELEDGFWEQVYREIKNYFETLDVLGWALDMKGSPLRLTPEVEKLHRKYFSDGIRLLYIADSIDKEEMFYVPVNQIFLPLDGYFIYYEKNTPMQEYMIHRYEQYREKGFLLQKEEPNKPKTASFGKNRVEAEKPENNRNEKFRQGKALAGKLQPGKDTGIHWHMTIYTASMIVILIICAVTVTLFNNYQKMRDLENTVSALADRTAQEAAQGTETDSADAVKVASVTKDGEYIEENVTDPAGSTGADTAASDENSAAPVGSTGTDAAVSDENSAAPGGSAGTDTAASDENSAAPTGGTAADAAAPDENAAAPAGDTGADAAASDGLPADSSTGVSAEAQTYIAQGYYIVQPGDSLITISQKIYGSKNMAESISIVNGLENWDVIYTGQKLKLPVQS